MIPGGLALLVAAAIAHQATNHPVLLSPGLPAIPPTPPVMFTWDSFESLLVVTQTNRSYILTWSNPPSAYAQPWWSMHIDSTTNFKTWQTNVWFAPWTSGVITVTISNDTPGKFFRFYNTPP